MKKHVLAAAVASALTVPAMAQTVEVYGVLDMGYSERSQELGTGNALSVTNAAGTATRQTAKTTQVGGSGGLSSSRLGFRGSENLGGGSKANFVLEMGITPDTSTSPFSSGTSGTRAAWVGLSSGDMGEVRVGRQNTIGKDMNDGYTPFAGGASFANGSIVHMVTGSSTQQEMAEAQFMTPATDRHSNTLTYITPTFSGFKVTAQYYKEATDNGIFAGRQTTSTGNTCQYNNALTGAVPSAAAISACAVAAVDGYAGRLDYNIGALSLSASRTKMKTQREDTTLAAQATQFDDIELNQMGVKYTLSPAITLFAAFADGERKVGGATAKTTVKGYDVGISYNISGPYTVNFQTGKGETNTAVATPVKTDHSGYVLQGLYALSKRTTAYGLIQSSELDTTGSSAPTEDKVYMVGIRHTF